MSYLSNFLGLFCFVATTCMPFSCYSLPLLLIRWIPLSPPGPCAGSPRGHPSFGQARARLAAGCFVVIMYIYIYMVAKFRDVIMMHIYIYIIYIYVYKIDYVNMCSIYIMTTKPIGPICLSVCLSVYLSV